MANDWIPMRTDLDADPSVIAIAAATGLDEYAVVGRLHKLWSWAGAQLTDGFAHAVTVQWVDRYLATPGFAAAMLAAGWLRTRSGGIEFPHFDRWNSECAKQRIRKTLQRQDQRSRQVGDNLATERRPEKRREEKSKEDPPAGAGSDDPGAAAPKKPPKTKPKTNPNHRPAVAAFCDAWRGKYGREYAFAGGKDADAVAWLLAQVGNDLEAFRALVGRYLADEFPFAVQNAHDLGTLRVKANRWLVAGAPRAADTLRGWVDFDNQKPLETREGVS